MKKRKGGLFTILIYAAIAVFSFVIIYGIVNGFSSKYQELTTGDFINFVLNNDEYLISSCTILQNNNETTVSFVCKNLATNSEQLYKITLESDLIYSLHNFNGEELRLIDVIHNSVNSVEGGTFVTGVYEESPLLSWLPTIITTGITIVIAIFLFRFLMSNVGGNRQAMDFNKSRARRIDNSKVKFDDVAGCDEEKAEMVEIVEYLKDPKKFTKCGAKLPRGVLLVGHPGTGKTLLAKAIAGEAGVPFFSISGSDFVEMFVGVGAGRVRDLFKTAKQNAPCLVFIDEIDAVGRQRGAGLGGGNDEREQTLNQLLVELDGFEDNSGIIVIAATNRDDVLDPALLRAGRFDRKITVSLPNKEGREAIFKVHAKGKKISSEVDFEKLATRTVGFSGADIANILNEAAILAVRGKRDEIVTADIDEAIDRVIAGPAKVKKGMSDFERKEVAYHESGHAIIGLTLPDSDKVRKITIIPRGQTGGHVLMGPEEDRFLYSKNQLLAEITGLLGGRASEEIFFKDVTTGASNDIERATMIARSMVVEYGMSSLGPIQYERNTGSVFLGRDYTNSERNFSTTVAEKIDIEIRNIIEQCYNKAKEIITTRKDDVVLIAETLLTNETISEEQIDYLLKNRKLDETQVQQKDLRLVKEDNVEPAKNSEVKKTTRKRSVKKADTEENK